MPRFRIETNYCIAAIMRLLYVLFMTIALQMVTFFDVISTFCQPA